MGTLSFQPKSNVCGSDFIYPGKEGFLVQVWQLALLFLTLLFLQLLVIPYEENQTQKQFGTTYRQYCTKVRRWI